MSPAAPEKRLQSHRCGLGAAGCSHLDRAGGAGRACGGSGQHREWGRHAEGPARGRGRAGQGRGEGWAGQARRKLRTTWGRPRTDAGPRPWGGGRQGGLCPASGSVGGAGWLRACPQAWPREDLASWGAVGILDVCEPPHPSVQELGWGGPGSGREALAGTRLALLPGLRRSARLRLWAACEIHPLLIHPLGLDPLDKAEEVLVRHGGATGQHVRGRAALVIYPGGLGGHGHAVGGLAPRPGGPAQCSAAPGTAVGRQRQLRRTARASLGPPGNQFHGQSWDP